MAAKSFLTPEQTDEALVKLTRPRRIPDGDEKKTADFAIAQDFSKWLGDCLLARLSSHPDWQAAAPVLLGSWARGELSPKSDIDLLFCGPEENVMRLVQDFSKQGLKLRYRVPEDPEDWTKGVEPFDVLALFSAVPLGEMAKAKLEKQISRLKTEGGEFRRDLLRAMRTERKARAERYDSISNFLEPNLKYGQGGLRDLEQALVTRELFPERFDAKTSHAFDVLLYHKNFLLLIRQKLHLSVGATDILTAPEQKPISEWFGFKDVRDFMREVQKGLSRVSFYADWVIEQATRPKSQIGAVETRKLDDVSALFSALEEDPSLLMQNRVRLASDRVFAEARSWRDRSGLDKQIGKSLSRFLDPERPEAAMVALFRSRLIDHCVPEYRKIIGYVQHDQYHRFSVDAHILQALRELKRLQKQPKLAGRLSGLVKSLTKKEWEILAFGCLYHDIAKGRGGDHSIKGVEIARVDLERFGKDEAFIRETCWIVEEHLGLSAAAFRENPRSPRTWRALADRGVKGRRLALLGVFTIVDIRATNPEAWTSWKERLLSELVEQLERPETDSLISFAQALKKSKIKGWEHYIEALDPFLVGSLPLKPLLQDLQDVSKLMKKSVPESASARVIRVRGGKQTWIRFHSNIDQSGLFLRYVSWLALSGLSVRHASIHTDPQIGVYDWFEVKTQKTPAQILKLLAAVSTGKPAVEKVYSVRFDDVHLGSSDDREWVISFRGRDQSGALTEAARALFEAGAEIRWAKVHTWGRQIDDVFGVVPMPDRVGGPEKLVEELTTRLCTLIAGPKV